MAVQHEAFGRHDAGTKYSVRVSEVSWVHHNITQVKSDEDLSVPHAQEIQKQIC